MGVLINEFEIVPTPQDAAAEPRQERTDEQQSPSEKLTARDVHTILHRREQRRERVWAH